MFELTINGVVYQFRFGMGFLREVNKTVVQTAQDNKNAKRNMGLQWVLGGVIDGDLESLVDILLIANKTEENRVTAKLLDYYIEEECTDVNVLFKEVLDFLRNANATKKTMASLDEMIAKENAKQEAEQKAKQEADA